MKLLWRLAYVSLRKIQVLGFWRAVSYGLAGLGLLALRLLWKASQVIKWRMSPRLPDADYVMRMEICGACPHLERVGGKMYCKQCGCPHTQWSELTTKNRRQGHNCPEGLHPGSKKTSFHREVSRPPGGCGGNGKAKAIKPSGEIFSGGNHGNSHMARDDRHRL